MIARGDDLYKPRNLADAINFYKKTHPRARIAETDKEAAERFNGILTRELYDYLKTHGFDPKVIVGKGFTGRLVNPSEVINDSLDEYGIQATKNWITHGMVKVGNIVIDFTYRRLGSEYVHKNNSLFSEIKKYWHTFLVGKRYLPKEVILKRYLSDSSVKLTGRIMAASKEYTWFKYNADRGVKLTNSKGSVTIRKGDIFGVLEVTKTHDKIIVLKEPKMVFKVEIKKSDKIMDNSKSYRGKVKLPEKTSKPKQKVKPVKVEQKPKTTLVKPKTTLVKPKTTLVKPKAQKIKINLNPENPEIEEEDNYIGNRILDVGDEPWIEDDLEDFRYGIPPSTSSEEEEDEPWE